MKNRKKLIEVALPLEAINQAAAREKAIRHGHPSTLHLWWARRPLAAARAVIFAQMVDDPSGYIDELLCDDPKLKKRAGGELRKRLERWEKAREGGVEAGPKPTLEDVAADMERERLFHLIEELVQWENTTNEEVLQRARDAIWASWRRTCTENADHPRARELFNRHKLPAFHDPFAGGGALPLEAQRLGLEAYASDLNPVAVLINKAMIEIPSMFAEKPPVNPEARARTDYSKGWRGTEGLAEDVRYYGKWVRDEAEKRIGHLYPKIKITMDMAKERPDLKPLVGKNLTVIAWLWARTVRSPNPAFAQVAVPLVSTFILSTKPGKQAYVEPVIENIGYRFTVKVGNIKNSHSVENGTKLSRGNFKCLMSGTPIAPEYIYSEAQAGRMGVRMMSIVAEGERGRIYLAPTAEHEAVASKATPDWRPEVEFFKQALGFRVGNYGMTKWSDLFTSRQLVLLSNFSDLVQEAHEMIQRDSLAACLSNDLQALRDGGYGARGYADAISIYLSCAVDRLANAHSSLVGWINKNQSPRNTFARQALPMVWDFCESNAFSNSAGNWSDAVEGLTTAIKSFPAEASNLGRSVQANAQDQSISKGKIVSTDPPYYDNIGYADLSDFFYVWLRRSLKSIFPELFATLAVPKSEELVATPGRHGCKVKAESFFLNGMSRAMHCLAEQTHPAFPVTIYYAFKQAESEGEAGTASTGWETFLDAVIRTGFVTTGTWPTRTEKPGRMRENASNALASSIVIVCRKRTNDAPTATRHEFLTLLKSKLPES